MDSFARLPVKERAEIFQETSERLQITPEAVEKDFWVVWVLGRLFASAFLGPKILFKGGTSLSKVFGLIDRFSEDIDLILDWTALEIENPLMDRSRTRQDRYNKAVPVTARSYLEDVFLPEMNRQLEGLCEAGMEVDSPGVLAIRYPSTFRNAYLRPEIRLEIGPLAQWIPNTRYAVRSYVAEVFPDLFEIPDREVQVIRPERTFWEKATILHNEAHRPESSSVPVRYSRHYYDLYLMSQDAEVKTAALGDLDLLASVVAFKQKFYPRGWAKYDLAKPGTLRLVPPERILEAMRQDYRAMGEMIFGRHPSWDEIVQGLRGLESEINSHGGQGGLF